MGALVAAFALALVVNPRLRIRASAYVFLLTLLLVPSVISSANLGSGFGALFRCFRLALFVGTLWLLSRWWDGGLTFVRHHIRMYFAVLGSVAAGLVVSPGAALPDLYGGRLVGALWPLTPPQIGQYAAVIIGLTVLLLLGRRTDRGQRRGGHRAVPRPARADPYPHGHARPAHRAGAGDRLARPDQRRRPPVLLLGGAVRRGGRGGVRLRAAGVVPARTEPGELLQPHRPGQGLARAAGSAPDDHGAAVRRRAWATSRSAGCRSTTAGWPSTTSRV